MKGLILALALLSSACATTQVNLARESVTTAVNLFSGGIKALDAADLATQSSLLAKVHSGALSNADANAQYVVFTAKYDVAMKAFSALWDAIQATADVTAAADAKLNADVPGAVSSLTKALSDVVNALAALNIKLPGTI